MIDAFRTSICKFSVSIFQFEFRFSFFEFHVWIHAGTKTKVTDG
jgi:hypothetical protein